MAWMLIPLLALVIIMSAPAHATYIDPGSGSYLFQLAIASLVGFGFAVRRFLHILPHKQKAEGQHKDDEHKA